METVEARLTRLAKPGDVVLRFQELEGTDERPPVSISFIGVEVVPLGYDALYDANLHAPLTVPLDWHNARVIEASDPSIKIDGYARVNSTLESRFSSNVISLQRGGWLPSGLAVTAGGVTILPDRNVFSALKGRFTDGVVTGSGEDFLDLLADHEGRINPILFAIEGNLRSTPDAETVAAQLREGLAHLRKALPKATLVFGPDSLRGAVGIIEDTRAGFESKRAFLLELAPTLKNNVSQTVRDQRWVEVLETADKHSVPRHSLVVLAALSIVAVPNGASPAAKVLKFKDGYADKEAYNALCDLRSLEMLIHLFGHFPDERPAFFTADKPLALFWVGIRADNFQRKGDGVSFDVSPVEALLPGSYLPRWLDDINAANTQITTP